MFTQKIKLNQLIKQKNFIVYNKGDGTTHHVHKKTIKPTIKIDDNTYNLQQPIKNIIIHHNRILQKDEITFENTTGNPLLQITIDADPREITFEYTENN